MNFSNSSYYAMGLLYDYHELLTLGFVKVTRGYITVRFSGGAGHSSTPELAGRSPVHCKAWGGWVSNTGRSVDFYLAPENRW